MRPLVRGIPSEGTFLTSLKKRRFRLFPSARLSLNLPVIPGTSWCSHLREWNGYKF
jgi:hypothetical protein